VRLINFKLGTGKWSRSGYKDPRKSSTCIYIYFALTANITTLIFEYHEESMIVLAFIGENCRLWTGIDGSSLWACSRKWQ